MLLQTKLGEFKERLHKNIILTLRVVKASKKTIVVPLCLLFFMLGFGLWGVFAISNAYVAYQKQVVVNIANNIDHDLRAGIMATLQPAMAMHTMIKEHIFWNTINHTFYELAPWLITNETRGAIITIVLAPFAIVHAIYPIGLPGWDNVYGLNLLKEPVWRNDALKTIDLFDDGMTVTGPVKLRAGPIGLVARSPIFIKAEP